MHISQQIEQLRNEAATLDTEQAEPLWEEVSLSDMQVVPVDLTLHATHHR